jgi:cobalt-zinc-cadmium efflux system outer membrane protein
MTAAYGLLLHPARGALAAQEAPEQDTVQAHRITLGDALDRVEIDNLSIRVAREDLAAARGRLTTAGVFANPGLAATREQLSGGSGGYDETTVALSQTLEIGGQRGLRRSAAGLSVDAEEARLAAERLRLAFEVRETYVRAAAAEANMTALGEATEVFRRVEQSGRARFAEGDISEFARERLQVERARYENLLAEARLDLTRAGRDLAMLVVPDSMGSEGFLLLPAVPLDGQTFSTAAFILDNALSGAADRADVRAATLDAEAARATLDLQHRERIPDLTLTGGYKNQADGFHGAIIGFSLPVPLLDRNAGRIEEARAELGAAEARRALVLRGAEADIQRAWETYRSLAERIELLNQGLLAGSGGLLQTAQAAYAEGEMSLVELLDAADAYRAARETTVDLLARYITALYDLQRATGRLNSTVPTHLDERR